MNARDTIQKWPEESREAAQIVIDKRGEPNEVTESMLVWRDDNAAPWKRVVASRAFYAHDFPAPHIDAVESFLDYSVPTAKFTAIAEYDGSVIVERTAGEVSARCHDEEANFLALNLMHDIVTGERTVDEAREYYSKEFLDYRRGKPTPYMEGLRFEPPTAETGDRDERTLTDEDIEQAKEEGREAA